MKTIYAVMVDDSEDGRGPIKQVAFFTNKEGAEKLAKIREPYKHSRSNRVQEHYLYESVAEYNSGPEELEKLKNNKEVLRYIELAEAIKNRK
jgi:hypothetical protein